MKRISILLTTLMVLGCGGDEDDPTGPTGNELSQTQVDFLADQVLGSAFAGLTAPPTNPSLAASSGLIFLPIDYNASCPVFGRTAVTGSISGSIDDQTGNGALLIDINFTWTDCTYSDPNGNDLTVNGDPFMSLAGNFSFQNFLPATQQTIQIGGGFRWDGAGGSGGCNVNLTFTFATAASSTNTVSGTFCGRSVNRTL